MSVNLEKGENIALTKENPGLKHVIFALGWSPQEESGKPSWDLDASAFLLNAQGQTRGDDDFVYYRHLKSSDGAIVHSGDNLTGAGEGDDEQIKVWLEKVSADIDKVVFVVTIYQGTAKKQNFARVKNAFIRVIDAETNKELAKYELSEEGGQNTAMIFAELYRREGEWKFKTIGEGIVGGLEQFVQKWGPR